MKIEAPRKVFLDAIGISTHAAGQFIFPLYKHKRESDISGKHEEWVTKKHLALTSLAVLIDLGFNFATALHFISGNYREAYVLKIAHILGADSLPEPLANLTNKVKVKMGKIIK